VKYGLSSKQRGTYCIGNRLDITWSARLEEHLGTISAELIASDGALLMSHRQRCYALQSMCALVLMGFEERDPHPHLFDAMASLIDSMRSGSAVWAADYARFEVALLRETGFGLGLERCVVTGQTHDLKYISPKSGCAVSGAQGTPYANKLLPYAPLLQAPMQSAASAQEVAQALEVTSYFLSRWLYPAVEKTAPAARPRFMEALAKQASAVLA
jgi:DNA repair protein RecO (recombination protein O)